MLEAPTGALAEMGFVFSVHAEEPNVFCLDRETAFIPKIKTLAQKFPKLRIVFEHVSTAAAVKAVLEMPSTVAATITAHHLTMTLDDVIGDALRPHHFCKPILKHPSDIPVLFHNAPGNILHNQD